MEPEAKGCGKIRGVWDACLAEDEESHTANCEEHPASYSLTRRGGPSADAKAGRRSLSSLASGGRTLPAAALPEPWEHTLQAAGPQDVRARVSRTGGREWARDAVRPEPFPVHTPAIQLFSSRVRLLLQVLGPFCASRRISTLPLHLCGLGQVTCPLRTSDSTCAKWVPASPHHVAAAKLRRCKDAVLPKTLDRSKGSALGWLLPPLGSQKLLPVRTLPDWQQNLGSGVEPWWAEWFPLPLTERDWERGSQAVLGSPRGKPRFWGWEPPLFRGHLTRQRHAARFERTAPGRSQLRCVGDPGLAEASKLPHSVQPKTVYSFDSCLHLPRQARL